MLIYRALEASCRNRKWMKMIRKIINLFFLLKVDISFRLERLQKVRPRNLTFGVGSTYVHFLNLKDNQFEQKKTFKKAFLFFDLNIYALISRYFSKNILIY